MEKYCLGLASETLWEGMDGEDLEYGKSTANKQATVCLVYLTTYYVPWKCFNTNLQVFQFLVVCVSEFLLCCKLGLFQERTQKRNRVIYSEGC
jgi:hypothetical protein